MNNKKKIPTHVGIIMDGNGRWAKKRLLPRSLGHKAGSDNLRKLCHYILRQGVKVLSVYAFSTENFKRNQDEVDYLMDLFVKKFEEELKEFQDNNIKVIFSGRKEPLRNDVWESMQNLVLATQNNTGGIFNICLNYGGQYEVVDAVKRMVNEKVDVTNLTPALLQQYLYQNLPPLDLVIRTSGEYRLSNFMMYQASYAEFYFTDTYFPDFNETEFDKAIEAYNNRNRRFGGDNK